MSEVPSSSASHSEEEAPPSHYLLQSYVTGSSMARSMMEKRAEAEAVSGRHHDLLLPR